MPDRIDTRPQAVQASKQKAVVDRVIPETHLEQLPARQNPMLLLRKRRQLSIPSPSPF